MVERLRRILRPVVKAYRDWMTWACIAACILLAVIINTVLGVQDTSGSRYAVTPGYLAAIAVYGLFWFQYWFRYRPSKMQDSTWPDGE